MKLQTLLLQACILFAFLSVASPDCAGQADSSKQGIHFFNGTWKEAVAKAKIEKKCIFLDAYASWCGPCKTMDKEVYSLLSIGKFFNKKFVSVRVDMEKGEGPMLAKRFTSIDGYPSLLFFGSDGNLAKTILGSRHATDFLQEAKLVAR